MQQQKRKRQQQQEEKDNKNKNEEVIRRFCKLIEQKVLNDKKSFFLIDLLGDISDLSEEEGFESVATSTKSLRKIIETNFEEMVSFQIVGKQLMIYSSDVNSCIYVAATLIRCRLRDDDLTKAFAKMVPKKIPISKQKWPLSAKELTEGLDSTGSFQHIYNAIAWSLHPERTLNKRGYVKIPSENEASKLWGISSNWESLITKRRLAKAAVLSLTVHQLIGSKETANYLHQCGHGISYADIQLLNTDWANRVTKNSSHKLLSKFQKGKAVHMSIDNSDGRQEKLTGAHTTHYTIGTVVQVDVGSEENEREKNQDERRASDEDITIEEVYGTFKIRKKVSPPSIIYEDKKDDDLLRWCLNRDLAWVLTSAVGQQVSNAEKLEPLGSWTAFMK